MKTTNTAIRQAQRELTSNLKAAAKRAETAKLACERAMTEFKEASAEHEKFQAQVAEFVKFTDKFYPGIETSASDDKPRRGGRRRKSGETNGAPAKQAKSTKASTTEKKTRGRKKSGGGKMVNAMKSVMGKKTMTAGQVEEGLIAKGKAPESSNLRGYISQVFSSATDENGDKIFEKVDRGQYRVADTTSAEAKPEKTETKAAAKAKPAKTEKAVETKGSTGGSPVETPEAESESETTVVEADTPAGAAQAMLDEMENTLGITASEAQAAPLS